MPQTFLTDGDLNSLQSQVDSQAVQISDLLARVTALESGSGGTNPPPPPPPPPSGTVYSVSSNADLDSLPWPLADGDVVEFATGTYNRKFMLSRGVTLRPNAASTGAVTIDFAGAATASPEFVNEARGGIGISRWSTDPYGY